MSSNESPFGASPKARAAYLKAADDLARYPDGDASALRRAIAARHGIEAERIVCGAGSDELLHLLAHLYLEAGDEAVHMRHGFAIYRIAILAAGGRPVAAEEENLAASADRIFGDTVGADENRFSRQPEQSDFQLHERVGASAPSWGAAEADASRD